MYGERGGVYTAAMDFGRNVDIETVDFSLPPDHGGNQRIVRGSPVDPPADETQLTLDSNREALG